MTLPRISSARRLLVLGGSGVTGRLITRALSELRPDDELYIASRRQRPRPAARGQAGAVALDALGPDCARVLAGYDLVIIALGPFSRVRARVHAACIEARVDCLDVNDAPDVIPEILALEPAARERGVRVLTGMGMCPGLTTLLLLAAVRATGAGPADLRVALWLGGDQPVGLASVQTMLGGFEPNVRAVVRGAARTVPADDAPGRAVLFPSKSQPARLFHLPIAEAETFTRSTTGGIERLDLYAHFEGLSPAMVRLLRSRVARFGPLRAGLERLTLACQPLARRSGRLHAESLAWVFERTSPENGILASGLGSYQITAQFAAWVAKALLERALQPPPGVVTAEALEPLLADALEALSAPGLRIERLGNWRDRTRPRANVGAEMEMGP